MKRVVPGPWWVESCDLRCSRRGRRHRGGAGSQGLKCPRAGATRQESSLDAQHPLNQGVDAFSVNHPPIDQRLKDNGRGQ